MYDIQGFPTIRGEPDVELLLIYGVGFARKGKRQGVIKKTRKWLRP